MITRTYINKFNTILKDSSLNMGINPIAELNYGLHTSRIICYFDHSHIKKMVNDKIFPDITKFKHTLHITNAGSLDFTQIHCGEVTSMGKGLKKRATSFDLLFFLIPQEWDRGKGFDYSKNAFNINYYDTKNPHNQSRLVSTDGSNWYKSENNKKWPEDGIYSTDTLLKEYDNFILGQGSNIIIGKQHFDVGNENISLDITDIFNKFLTGDLENHGIGIAYIPDYEYMSNETSNTSQYNSEALVDNYVGFLTDKTNTFFEPYVETKYEDVISDDRNDFVIDKNNKLYLYCTIGGKLENLDQLPTCKITGNMEDNDGNISEYEKDYEVKQATKGVYYIDITLPYSHFKGGTMLYDTWDGIVYQGNNLKPVELDFTLKDNDSYFSIGNSIQDEPLFVPSIFGIQDNEVIKRGDIRKLGVVTRVKYNTQETQLIDGVSVRIYVKDGEREIDVIPWDRINKTLTENYMLVDTNMLIPQMYYVDIKIDYGMQSIIHHDMLHFKIVDDLNNKYA